MRRSAACAVMMFLVYAACGGGGEPANTSNGEYGPKSKEWGEAALSKTEGTVGRPFSSRVMLSAKKWVKGKTTPMTIRGYFGMPDVDIEDLPTGLKFDKGRRLITGTPTKEGNFEVTIWYRDKKNTGSDSRGPYWWDEKVTLSIAK